MKRIILDVIKVVNSNIGVYVTLKYKYEEWLTTYVDTFYFENLYEWNETNKKGWFY